MTLKQEVNYWDKLSYDKYLGAISAFKSKRWLDSLFWCHLSLEMELKAVIVLRTQQTPKFVHQLIRLANDAGLQPTPQQEAQLNIITSFNIAARYPNYKQQIYQTFGYAKAVREQLTIVRQWRKFLKNIIAEEIKTVPNNYKI